MVEIPAREGGFRQSNNGPESGNIFASFNLDLKSKEGQIRVSEQVLKSRDQNEDADLDGYAAAFAYYDGAIHWVSDKVYKTNTPDGTVTEMSLQSTSNAITDMVVFNDLLLYTQTDDIRSWNGSVEANWWTSTVGGAALTTGDRHYLEVGPGNDVFVTDNSNGVANLVKRVASDGINQSETGAGTLDFSATPYRIRCMVSNSSRLWLGMENTADGEGAIAEWDMGEQSLTPNRIHKIGANACLCIAVWNDTPIAVLSDGNIKYYDGSSFVDLGSRFPTKNLNLDDGWIHPNGWAIIDDLPHFLVSFRQNTAGDTYQDMTASRFNLPAGVWCYDPNIGVYHRFAVGAGLSSQIDKGQMGVEQVGALFATDDPSSKFMASYEYYETSTNDTAAVAYHDKDNTKPGTAYLCTSEIDVRNIPKMVEAYHKKLASGEEVRFYYRQDFSDSTVLDGAWADGQNFHTTESVTGLEAGNLLIIKTGQGSGSLHRIANIDSSSGTNVITIDESNSFITANHQNTVEVVNFKRVAEITDTVLDWHQFNIPTSQKSRKVQVLIEMRQAASNNLEVDSVIIT